MRKCLLVWVVMGVVLGLSGALADSVTNTASQGPALWVWLLLPVGSTQPAGTVVELTNPSGQPWTLPGAWTVSAPTLGAQGWTFDTSVANGGGTSVLRWTANANGGPWGAFTAAPVGAHNTGGNYSIEQNGAAPPEWSGSLNVPVVPEAGTVALLALGLFAGALAKRRKILS